MAFIGFLSIELNWANISLGDMAPSVFFLIPTRSPNKSLALFGFSAFALAAAASSSDWLRIGNIRLESTDCSPKAFMVGWGAKGLTMGAIPGRGMPIIPG